jgi:hypothetical protein
LSSPPAQAELLEREMRMQYRKSASQALPADFTVREGI